MTYIANGSIFFHLYIRNTSLCHYHNSKIILQFYFVDKYYVIKDTITKNILKVLPSNSDYIKYNRIFAYNSLISAKKTDNSMIVFSYCTTLANINYIDDSFTIFEAPKLCRNVHFIVQF